MQQIVQIQHLRLSRSRSFALAISGLQISAGHTLCVVGPNGSGKTTLMECLAGILMPTSGEISIAGMPVTTNVRGIKRLVGFIPDDEHWLIQELCAKEYFALLKGVYRQAGCENDMQARIASLAATLQFTAFDLQLRHLSHGNKKKVQIIAALMHRPHLLIVDEIRNGLDPLAIITVEALLREEVAGGMALVAATHDLWWAERIADDVVLLLGGSVAIHDKKDSLVARHGSLEKLFMHTLRKSKHPSHVV
jgi:ABC-2 type transport system ATP-binding protein